ncbi:hypothetical protein EVG20_g4114 [Dentipellis fragilis]|uniref:BTB domain-containing protein n=1 Tax=Dentipellis fragilis TaxID=205917 RepID=A0A4Y9YZD4_9AGAM|nr:hypothetical protein EVG20_g4114 [Dentipellis fragilis]
MSSAGLSPSDVEDFDFDNLSDSSLQQRSEADSLNIMPQPIVPSGASFESVNVQTAGQTKSMNEQLVSAAAKSHARFVFDDGNVEFLVQDTLYRVHRYFFCRDSPYFADLLESADASPARSVSVVLDDIESSEFDAFLSILYPTKFHECDVTTVEGWTSVLRLSTKWSFSSIRTLAIERLESIASPVDKVVLGRTYGVDSWVVPGLVALCERPQYLAREEGRRLGVDDVIIIAAVREDMRSPKSVAAGRPTRDKVRRMVEACLASHENTDPVLVERTLSNPKTDAGKGTTSFGDNLSAGDNASGSGSASDTAISGFRDGSKTSTSLEADVVSGDTIDEETPEQARTNKLLELKKKAEEAENAAAARRKEEAVAMKILEEEAEKKVKALAPPKRKHSRLEPWEWLPLFEAEEKWIAAKFRAIEASAAARWAEHEAKLRAEALAMDSMDAKILMRPE